MEFQSIHEPLRLVLFMLSIGSIITGLVIAVRASNIPLFAGVVTGASVAVWFMLH